MMSVTHRCLLLITYFCLISAGFSRKIEKVDDSQLVSLIKSEDSVVVLFTKENCPKCEELEDVLDSIQDELRENLGCGIVTAFNSQMITIYDPTKEPSLIFFRRGIPLLYDGNINGEEIVQLFNDNQEPVVKELSDSTFEHLTQASTGATTGDWFIFFYSSDCVSCRKLFAIWEGVGATLKRRLNVARVNRLQGGVLTAKRFNIDESPVFLFIRQGKVYRFKGKDLTVKGFVNFIDNLHTSKIKPEAVPPVSVSGFRDIAEPYIKLLLENRNYQIYAGSALSVILLIILATKACKSTKKQPTKAPKAADKKKKK